MRTVRLTDSVPPMLIDERVLGKFHANCQEPHNVFESISPTAAHVINACQKNTHAPENGMKDSMVELCEGVDLWEEGL